MLRPILLSLLTALLLLNCTSPTNESAKASAGEDDTPREIKLDKINLPDGFKIEVYASDVVNARSMSRSPNGISQSAPMMRFLVR